MARKTSLTVVKEVKPDADSPERFARMTRHLKTGTGQPLQSMAFKLAAEKEARDA